MRPLVYATMVALTLSAPATAQQQSSPPVVSGQPGPWLVSKLIGTPVHNAQDEQIGTIVDLVMDPEARVTKAIISVGQYLGIGGRKVQVPLSTLRFPASTTGSGNPFGRLGPEVAVLVVTKATLQSLPPVD